MTYSRPPAAKPPRPLKNSSCSGSVAAALRPVAAGLRTSAGARGNFLDATELFAEGSPAPVQYDPRQSGKSSLGEGTDQIGPQHEYLALANARQAGLQRSRRTHHRFQRRLQILHIRGATFVENDQIGDELLGLPVFARPQQFADELEVLDVLDAHENERIVAGNAVRPQHRLARRILGEMARRRPQRGVGVQEMADQRLEEARFLSADHEMTQLDLRLGPGESHRAFKSGDMAMPIDQLRSSSRDGAAIVHRRTWRCLRRRSLMRRRRAKIGSSTVPIEFESVC